MKHSIVKPLRFYGSSSRYFDLRKQLPSFSSYLDELFPLDAVGADTVDDLREVDPTGEFKGRFETLYVR